MEKLKNLKDGSRFQIQPGSVYYTLQKLDHKKKLATYTSEKSGMTFTKGWGKKVFV